jgi:hypothetical protein
MSNSPVEWAKRARNLADQKLFQYAAQCYGCAGDVMRAAAYGAMHLLHVSWLPVQRLALWAIDVQGNQGLFCCQWYARLCDSG